MAGKYKSFLTNLGLAKLAAALAAGERLNFLSYQVGDGGGHATTPGKNKTSLIRKVYSGTISRFWVSEKNPNQVYFEFIIPGNVGGFSISEFALLDDSDAVVVVGAVEPTYKPLPETDAAAIQMVFRAVVDVGNADAISLSVDANVYLATMDWANDRFLIQSFLEGGTTGQVLRKRSNEDLDFEWVDPTTGQTVLVDIIEENQTLTAGQKSVTLSVATTDSAAIYIDGNRLRSDEWTVVDDTHLMLSTAGAAGQAITIVQNDPKGASNYLKIANNLGEIAAAGSSAVDETLTNLGLNQGGAAFNALKEAFLGTVYPVGHVLIQTKSTNPSETLGFGTWKRTGQGRAVIGVNESDSDFSSANKLSGSKTTTLTSDQIPSHSHSIAEQKTLSTANGGAHSHSYKDRYLATRGNSDARKASYRQTVSGYNANICIGEKIWSLSDATWLYKNDTTGSATAHSHTFSVPAHATTKTGGGSAHSNLQPGQAFYIFERTA